jgi:hypothetical protein
LQTTYYKQPLEYCSIAKVWQGKSASIKNKNMFIKTFDLDVSSFLDLKESSEFDQRKAAIAEFNKVDLI